MLTVTFTVEPFGFVERARTIYEIKIANVDTNWANQADYIIICKGENLKRQLKGNIKKFDREEGAIQLVREALNVLLEKYPEKLKAPPPRPFMPVLIPKKRKRIIDHTE